MAVCSKRRLLRLVFTATLLLTLVACGGRSHDIVGKWKTSSDPNSVTWEFAANGQVIIGDARGRYTFGDQNRIKIEMPFGVSMYDATVYSDHMSFRDAAGSRLEFDRVK